MLNDTCKETFNLLQDTMTRAPMLAYPDPARLIIIDTYASNVGASAVLSQEGNNGENNVAYFSQALNRVVGGNVGTPSFPVIFFWEEFPAADRPCFHYLAAKISKSRRLHGKVAGDPPGL